LVVLTRGRSKKDVGLPTYPWVKNHPKSKRETRGVSTESGLRKKEEPILEFAILSGGKPLRRGGIQKPSWRENGFSSSKRKRLH